jgi:prepilin-type N-terminal cleavage/methylation domain-containing protein
MKPNSINPNRPKSANPGFSLVEVMVGIAVFGVTCVSLYAGVTFGFNSVKLARENLRATQILVEKMEVIRLYSWDEINQPGFIPATFQATCAPGATVTTIGQGNKEVVTPAEGVTYYGTITVNNLSTSENYRQKIKRIDLTVRWTMGKLERSRSLSTLVTEDGLHAYVY